MCFGNPGPKRTRNEWVALQGLGSYAAQIKKICRLVDGMLAPKSHAIIEK